jgi:hypothetical protein
LGPRQREAHPFLRSLAIDGKGLPSPVVTILEISIVHLVFLTNLARLLVVFPFIEPGLGSARGRVQSHLVGCGRSVIYLSLVLPLNAAACFLGTPKLCSQMTLTLWSSGGMFEAEANQNLKNGAVRASRMGGKLG